MPRLLFADSPPVYQSDSLFISELLHFLHCLHVQEKHTCCNAIWHLLMELNYGL